VLCVAPGPINGTVGGPSGRVFGQMMSKSGASEAKYQVPTGRFGEISDIANSCIFLCSPAGSYVSATTLVVDAGHWHRVTMQYQRAKDFIAKQSQNERKTHKGGVKVKANL